MQRADSSAPEHRVPRWEHFSHVADIGVRGFGANLAEAFEQAALALTSAIADLDSIEAREAVEIRCEAPNPDLLFVDWLNELVFEMATRRMLFREFEIEIHGSTLHGRAIGETVQPSRHFPAAEIKGATMSELRVGQISDGCWRAQCIVDV